MGQQELISFEQGQVLGILLKEDEYCSTYVEHITPSMFSGVNKSIYTSIKEYWQKYNRTIPKEILVKEIMFREGDGLDSVKKDNIIKALQSCSHVDDRATEYVTGAMEMFITKQLYSNNLADLWKQSQTLIGNVDFVDKIQPLVRKLEDSLSPIITIKPEMAYAGLDDRTEYRMRVETGDIERVGVATGIRKLDDLLPFNGMENGWIGIVVGPTGRGKSIYLLQMAYTASTAGYNVVFVTLELSNQMLLDRYDASVSYMPISSIFKQAGTVREKIKTEQENPTKGRPWGEVAFLDFSDRSITVSELKAEVENLKRKHGFDTHLLVVDYLDLLKPDKTSKEGGWKDQQQITVGLRQMGNDLGFPVWTASQANRGASAKVEEDKEIDLESMAESYSKATPADIVLTINQKKSDKDSTDDRKKMVLSVAKNRNGPTASISIFSDFSRMRFYVGDYTEEGETLVLKSGEFGKI